MNFQDELVHGRLNRRIKRFLAEVTLDDGAVVMTHCTNSGSMKTCLEENAEVYLSHVTNPDRWTRFTWEMIKINGNWIGINTNNPNRIVHEGLVNNLIPGLTGFTTIRKEVTFGDSRFDFYTEKEIEKCFIEVKNVTMKVEEYARFPDAVTERGRKHLLTLAEAKKKGFRAVMVYVIQRPDVRIFAPAWDIDSEYGKTLKFVFQQGVEIIPLQLKVNPEKLEISGTLPFTFL